MNHPAPDHAFPALLRYWRGARGLSQLDLAGAADVSPKHISFLETGRSKPSRDMVLRLGSTLAVPLREQNALLVAAGFRAAFRDERAPAFDPTIRRALKLMMEQQEPYPLLVMDRAFNILMLNAATRRFFGALLGKRAAEERNAMKMLFDPTLLRPHVEHWERAAKALLVRMQRDVLARPGDQSLSRLLSELCSYEGVPADWRQPDYETPSEAAMTVAFSFMGQRLAFLSTMTVFQAPQDVCLEELCIESYFPLDEATHAACAQIATALPAPEVNFSSPA